MIIVTDTLPETNIAPENWPSQEETSIPTPSIFRGELLVSGRVNDQDFFHQYVCLPEHVQPPLHKT